MRSLFLALVFIAGCRESSAPPERYDFATGAPAFVREPFEELYPVFLWHSSMSQGEKAERWTRYRDRWVRWQGVIASFNEHGVTFRQLLSTVTFDVSLTCDHNVTKPSQRFSVGDRVVYVGRLDSYDDVFRTLYLTHGSLLEKVPHGDLGVPFDLSR